jgi:5-methylcytosine-specific restriction endonuclease McrA
MIKRKFYNKANYKKRPHPQKIKSKENLKLCVERDGRCVSCGARNDLAAHHIIYKSLGGDDSIENLITLCFNCHSNAHDGYFEDWTYIDGKTFIISVLNKLPVTKYKKVIMKKELL